MRSTTIVLLGLMAVAAVLAAPAASAHFAVEYHDSGPCEGGNYVAYALFKPGGTLPFVHVYSQNTVAGGCFIAGV